MHKVFFCIHSRDSHLRSCIVLGLRASIMVRLHEHVVCVKFGTDGEVSAFTLAMLMSACVRAMCGVFAEV